MATLPSSCPALSSTTSALTSAPSSLLETRQRKIPNMLIGVALGLGAMGLCYWLLKHRYADDDDIFDLSEARKSQLGSGSSDRGGDGEDEAFGAFAQATGDVKKLAHELSATLLQRQQQRQQPNHEQKILDIDERVTRCMIKIDSMSVANENDRKQRKALIFELSRLAQELAAAGIDDIKTARKQQQQFLSR